MNVDRATGWIALGANLGVVGGLVLLAMELRQNTQVVRAEAITSRLAGHISAETAFMGEDTAAAMARALATPDEVTDVDILRLWAYLNVAVMSVEQTHTMYELGLATEEDRRAGIQSAGAWLTFPLGQIWWEEMKSGMSQELVADIDAVIAADPDMLQRTFEAIQRRVHPQAGP